MIPPELAWTPMPEAECDEAAARHLAARLGYSVNPGLVKFIQERICRHLGGSYPDMRRSLVVSAAMVRYLNLNQNRKGSPNENFARELFELFCLGEGNSTEQDIKEAARALTGFVAGPES